MRALEVVPFKEGSSLDALEKSGHANNTIIIFTSYHGYHLGEHDFLAKVSLYDESARVPLIVSVPGKKPGVSDSLVELLDLYPSLPGSADSKSPRACKARTSAPFLMIRRPRCITPFSASPERAKGLMLRDDRWVFIQYGEDAKGGIELFNMQNDPRQFNNLAKSLDHISRVEEWKTKITEKLAAVRTHDLGK